MNVITLLVYVSVVLNNVSSLSRAGIYMDNGLDQTTIDKDLTKKEKIELELELLNILGLPYRPRKTNTSLNKSNLKYLLDVYNSLMIKEREELNHRSRRSANIEKHVEESDMIVTFDSIVQNGHIHREKGTRLWFDVSEMPVAEDVVGAELRVFQNGSNLVSNVFTISIYEHLDSMKSLHYISSVNTSGNFVGWLSLNLTSCLQTWINIPDSNKGLYLSVKPVDTRGREIRLEYIGLLASNKNEETKPFMVAFLKHTSLPQRHRTKRSSPSKSEMTTYPTVIKSYQNPGSWSTVCRIRTLYVSFKDLRWQDWIIAPEGYAAYYCLGECKFPLTGHMNASNHALVQSLMRLKYPDKFPKPCCAPTETKSLYMIYRLADNAVLKKRKDMVVKSCGCL